MDLRPRKRETFSGFTKAEIEKMEHLLKESKGKTLDQMFCKKLAKKFSYAKDRAGRPIVKWIEVQNWFQNRLQDCCTEDSSLGTAKKDISLDTAKLETSLDTAKLETSLDTAKLDTSLDTAKLDTSKEQCASLDTSKEQCASPESCLTDKIDGSLQIHEDEKAPDLSKLEFEAKSSKDGAWYDVDKFLAHRFLKSGESEVLVRYLGFGPEDDEWVIVAEAVRERSVPLEHSECLKVNVGDLVVCFQESREQARYFDAHVLEIHRRLHDIRGCRCLFLVRYDHDYTEENVHLERLCYRPNTS